MNATRILVSGEVQGVGYRNWTERTAARLGLRGWVRNLADGKVEIWAEGDDGAIAELIRACHVGPRAATVSAVEVAPRPARGHAAFTVARSALSPEP